MSKAITGPNLRADCVLALLFAIFCWIGPARASRVVLPLPRPHALGLLAVPPFETLPAHRLDEPFGLATERLRSGGLHAKWRGVVLALAREHGILTRCRADRGLCPPAAKAFLAVIERALTRQGLARVGEINRSVNLLIRPVDDLTQYGIEDRWSSPLETFATRAGDCEDYAIAKYAALRQIGFAEADLRIVVVHNRTFGYHAVTAVRFEGRWLVLDNRYLAMRQDQELTQLQPVFVLDASGVRRLVARKPAPVFADELPARMRTVDARSPGIVWPDLAA